METEAMVQQAANDAIDAFKFKQYEVIIEPWIMKLSWENVAAPVFRIAQEQHNKKHKHHIYTHCGHYEPPESTPVHFMFAISQYNEAMVVLGSSETIENYKRHCENLNANDARTTIQLLHEYVNNLADGGQSKGGFWQTLG